MAKMEKLISFLEDRGISREDTERMKNNKIDCDVLLLLEDEELSEYLPLYGDRLAAKNFARRLVERDLDSTKRKEHLRNLRAKMHRPSPQNSAEDGPLTSIKGSGNKNAIKSSRRIELGWLNYDVSTNQYKQVRAKTGGGIRHLKVDKIITVGEILSQGKQLFFPECKSIRGHIDDFCFEMKDFKQEAIASNTTVASLYEQTKMLRCYMCTKKKESAEKMSDDGELPDASHIVMSTPTTSSTEKLQVDEDVADVTEHTISVSKTSASDQELPDLSNMAASQQHTCTEQNGATEMIVHSESGTGNGNPNPAADTVTDPRTQVQPAPGPSGMDLDVTLPYVTLTIHRGNCLQEMVHYFKDPGLVSTEIACTMVLPNGTEKHGYGDGVFRDCLTQFWNEFYESSCDGNEKKVPTIRHDFQQEEWMSIGRIIYKGWIQASYFPIALTPIVIELAMFGDYDSDLVNSFLDTLSTDGKTTLQQAIVNFPEDLEDLVDTLDDHKCRVYPTKENLKKLVHEVAHKELVQTPAYIIESWSHVLKDLAKVLSPEDLHKLYDDLEPTNRKVTKLLKAPEIMSDSQRETMNYLRRFVRETDGSTLKNFLRFTTGSDLMLQAPKVIEVIFYTAYGLQRTPIAHTCGTVLKLPSEYERFAAFRSEFNNLLSSGVWIMDIA